MDFSKYNVVVAEPPADAGRAASGDSPLKGAIEESLKGKKWRGFLGVPTAVVAERTRRGTTEKYSVREFQVLCEELKRAARQLDVGLQLRVKDYEDGEKVDVYFLAGEKRKYVQSANSNEKSAGDDSNVGDKAGESGSAETAKSKK